MSGATMSACQTARAVRRGEVSAEEAVGSALARIEAVRGLNAVTAVDPDAALARARELDAKRRRGARLGALAGVPLAIKDNICTRGLPTTCGSRLLEGFMPPYDATATARLVAQDAIVVAKTNCDEFGMGSSNENSSFGAARNPHDPERTPGGSSGGSAALVAAGAVPLALGSDTGGSVRQPAAFCGVVGLKPTYGRVSRWGLVAFASSLDQIGPIARNTEDVAAALSVASGPDGLDATASGRPAADCLRGMDEGVEGLRALVIEPWDTDCEVDARVLDAVAGAAAALADAGARVDSARLPLARYAIPAYYVLATAEASSNLARHDGVRYGRRARGAATIHELFELSRGEGFGDEVKRRIILGTFVLSAGYRDALYGRALRARDALRAALDALLAEASLLVLPTVSGAAFRLGEKTGDPLAMYVEDEFTVPASLGGHPALSVPAPRERGQLPVGVQLIAPRFAEGVLLAGGRCLERAGFRSTNP